MQDRAFLVLGATGRTGSRVVARLRQRGEKVRARARSTSPGFDWHDEATWKPALEGVTSAYVVAAQTTAVRVDEPDRKVGFAAEQVARFCRLASRSGVRHIVLLSGRTGLSGSPYITALERAVTDSGADWTILRPGSFAQNFVTEPARSSIAAGSYQAFDIGGQAQDFIDVDDIAAVAVEALTAPGHDGKVYELSGPEALTGEEAAGIIARTLGRPVTYSEIPPDGWARQARAQGLTEESIDWVLTAVTSMRDGYFRPHDGVQRVLGRLPRPFGEFVAQAAAAGAWGPVHPGE
ncbi:NAD(P)H-binding protein [Streptomyces ipomoeae]|uniref:NAD(P)H-binding protein n=1 Tax=Streptomyces ipomoeae TaxID=103232 RepID=UPI0015F01499|nr:NmrA family NAD(P)-binding protein [Streptomyces ipomoeae]MDX2933462.1 NAD(P)H-binding protein [Streptomyces ipomoeae]